MVTITLYARQQKRCPLPKPTGSHGGAVDRSASAPPLCPTEAAPLSPRRPPSTRNKVCPKENSQVYTSGVARHITVYGVAVDPEAVYVSGILRINIL